MVQKNKPKSLLSLASTYQYGPAKESQTNQALILDILEKDWPLTIKEIYYILKKEHSRELTYQAVFKTVKLMANEGVLTAEKREYKLNTEWLCGLRDSIERKIRSYMLKEMQLSNAIGIPSDVMIEILRFIYEVGPKAEAYLGDDKGSIIVSSVGAYAFATALQNYLVNKNKEVNRVILDRFINIPLRNSLYGRKVIAVDSGTNTGQNYRFVMKMLKSVKKKYKIKDIKFAVYFDRAGVADWSCAKANTHAEYIIYYVSVYGIGFLFALTLESKNLTFKIYLDLFPVR